MIEFLGITIVIIVLYARTYKHCWLIDDFVPRGGYLVALTEEMRPDSPAFYDTRRPIMATVTGIGVFWFSCMAICYLFGWKAALLYAVLPTNVSSVAWSTGNYYQTTVLLTLVSYLYAKAGTFWTMFTGMWFYVAALGSTVSAMPFAFVFPLITDTPAPWLMFVPLFFFVFGNRFQIGLRKRKERHDVLGYKSGEFSITKAFIMVKVTAYNMVINLWPSRMGFWHDFMHEEFAKGKEETPTRLFWLSLVFNIVFFYWCYSASPIGAIWLYGHFLIFSQFTTFGQFVAPDRYLPLANVGFCVCLANFVTNPVLFAVICTLYFYRSHLYIKVFKHNKAWLLESIDAFPNTPANYNNLANIYIERRQWLKAVEPLLLAEKFTSGDTYNVHANLSTCYLQMGYFDTALKYSKLAWMKCPDDQRKPLAAQIADLERRIDLVRKNKKTLKKHGII